MSRPWDGFSHRNTRIAISLHKAIGTAGRMVPGLQDDLRLGNDIRRRQRDGGSTGTTAMPVNRSGYWRLAMN